MIRFVYSKERLWNVYEALWCFLIFLVNNLIFFFVVLKITFRDYVQRPPWYVVIIGLLLLLADISYTPYKTKNICNKIFLIDMLVWILVLISFFLPSQNDTTFFGLAISFRIYDAIYLKQMLYDMTRRQYWLYKIYIIGKIVYMILIYGHVTGCIFYALEMVLLNNQVFGEFALNPNNYYQGQLLAFTPIYMFEDLNRYTYAMYYIFSLISTIAFGDIIGKNYIEDGYVMILLIISTIMLAIIIEQMYIIFRRKKSRYLELLNQVRFLSQRLKEYKQIPQNFRYLSERLREQIINYLIEANWRYINEQPDNIDSNTSLKAKLIRQSVVCNSYMPTFFSKYILHKLTLTHYPNGVQLSYNSPDFQSLICNFVIRGKFWIGYETRKGMFPGGYELIGTGLNFGVEESLVNTNSIYPWLCIRTVDFCIIFTLNAAVIRQTLEQLQIIETPYDSPVEYYQIAKEDAIFKKNKYKCSICNTYQHTLLNCPQCHLAITNKDIYSRLKASQQRKFYKRNKISSKKVLNLSFAKNLVEENEEEVQRLEFILKLKERIKALRLEEQQQDHQIEQWFRWNVYRKEQNKQITTV